MKLAACAFFIPAFWITTTSFLFCYMAGHLDLFTFPYTQWPEIAWQFPELLTKPHNFTQFRHLLLWPFLWAPLISTAILTFGAIGWHAAHRQSHTQSLYGGSQWAGENDLSSGKIHSKPMPPHS